MEFTDRNRTYKKRFFHGGEEILRCRILLPAIEQFSAIDNFYRGLEEQTSAFCEGALLAYARHEYEAVRGRAKRGFYAPICYTLEGKERFFDRELLSIHLVARLERAGETPIVRRWEEGEVWELSEESLLPPSQVLAWYGDGKNSRKARSKEIRSVLLSEEGLLVLSQGEDSAWERISEKKEKSR